MIFDLRLTSNKFFKFTVNALKLIKSVDLSDVDQIIQRDPQIAYFLVNIKYQHLCVVTIQLNILLNQRQALN